MRAPNKAEQRQRHGGCDKEFVLRASFKVKVETAAIQDQTQKEQYK